MDDTRLKPRKSQSFQVVRCDLCGTEVVIDKARGAQCPKCGAGRETGASAPPVPVEEQSKAPNVVSMPNPEPPPAADNPEQMTSRRIQNWRSSVSDSNRPPARYGNRPAYAEPRGPRPPERENRSEPPARPDRIPDRNPERSYERGPGFSPDRSDRSHSSERGYNRDRGQGSDRSHGPDRGHSGDRGQERGRGSERGYGGDRAYSSERGHERTSDRSSYRGPERGPNRGDRGPNRDRADRGDRGPNRGMAKNQGPRYGRNDRNDRRPAPPDVPSDVKRKVLAAWEELRRQDERPPEGRRVKIASQFGLSFDQVTAIIKEQPRESRERRERSGGPPPKRKPIDLMENLEPALRRDIGFQIEKAYFTELNEVQNKRPWKVVVRSVARRVRRPEGAVAGWLQMLHRKSKRMIRAQKPDEVMAKQIIDAYQAYLNAEKPPEMSLHKTLAAQLGVKQRQIHRVLFEYRWRLRNKAVSGPPIMVFDAEPSPAPSPSDGSNPAETASPSELEKPQSR